MPSKLFKLQNTRAKPVQNILFSPDIC
jgi:hypothetical protein